MADRTSRREFLKLAGKTAVGAAAFSAFPSVLGFASENATEGAAQEVAPLTIPLAWHELDKATVQARVYEQWFELGGCGAALVDGILGSLADQYGYPYNQFPNELGYLGHSGYTAASYCGALGGATLALSLFIPKENQDEVLGQLQAWYTSTVLPIYEGEYDDVHTQSASVNCADSVGAWMKAAGVEDRKDPRRKSRCAALSADVAAKTIELINVFYGLEAPAEAATEAADAENVYYGKGTGMDGDVEVKVTVEDGKIANVEVVSQNETPGIGSVAVDELPQQFVGLSTADEVDALDAVSGATVTSTALKEAVKAAFAQVK